MYVRFTFCCIILGNYSSTLEDKLVKLKKRAAQVILDCDCYTPSAELFKELNWQTFLERATYQKAIAMYRIINNICPDYLKKTMSHILLTYHVDILDLLTVTNYIRQNLTASFSASHSCTLELPSGILSPNMLKMQLRLMSLSKMETLKRPLNYQLYYYQSDSVFCTDLVNDSVFCIDLVNDSVFCIDPINVYFMSFIWLAWFGIDVLVSV